MTKVKNFIQPKLTFGKLGIELILSELVEHESQMFGMVLVEDIDLRVTRQERLGYSYGHCQKPGAKLEDSGPKMGLRPGYGIRPVVTIIIMVELVV